ncbi:thiamine-phosphate diphosphorylase [Rhodobacter aestuarii]|uniref:Thiamine-phosphate synthase n=1 Tax=Rhodobacter aestuarii TaxID=453582 RepID=A0A1N7J0I5_9RHOB|nr:thiamine phosphate synthase [Rhodobacter aestuarii]PTV97324.1 thiamine-phosphate diphosphorylase [Rhodobacter aestuarii]SIS42767.1 thiamine-phosphate diphosphorylase [Rhodobacter aestuarii]
MSGPIYVITDPGAPLDLATQARAAALGGAAWVQLRDKTASDADLLALARQLLPEMRALGARLVINDRVEVAIAAGAEGLHIGQGDGDVQAIRAQIGPDMILGLSIETLDQARALPPGVDYIGAGPLRATATKPDAAAPIGFDGLAQITRAVSVPCYAIGGLGLADIPALKAAGVAGMAVVSAVTRAPDPQAATQALLQEWRL